MKKLITILTALLVLTIAHQSFAERHMAANSVTCSWQGTIHAKASSDYEARSLVSNKCFDAHMDKFAARSGGVPGDEQVDAIIDSCVNDTICK